MKVALKRSTPLIMGFAFTSFAVYTLLQSHPLPTVTLMEPAGGIVVTDQYDQKDLELSELMRGIIARQHHETAVPAIHAQVLVDIPLIVDSTATTKILDYNVHLLIKTPGQTDGRLTTTIRADDGTLPEQVKEQAVTELSHILAGQLTVRN